MTPERRRKIETLYRAALEQEPENRSSFVGGACGGDEDLRREVQLRLDESRSTLEHPASEVQIPSRAELTPGTLLGPYRIEGRLGSGGMGDVYRANDPRLHRDVALKIAVAQFSERSAREARLVAALNHPNICHVYDVGPNYLVMELVDGPTLAERLRQGPIPVDEALAIAKQIGDALEAAHEKGIVHRDLKPGNIKIRTDGTVKVLDFGLAKATEDAYQAGNPEDSPTMTLQPATRAGAIMGTAAYMSPEQARGKAVDKRADIWAFGVVLYEMLTGRRLFTGESVSDILAAVLTREPEWNRVPPRTLRLLRRCLERDPKLRLKDIGDARFLLDDGLPEPARESSRALPWKLAVAALALLLTGALAFLWTSTRRSIPSPLQLSVDLGENASLAPRTGVSMALSPDGSRLVFVTGSAHKSSLALRRLDQAKAVPLAGTDGAEGPFFSPDGKSIAFFADGKLKRMDAAGSVPVTLCDAPTPRGGSWGDDEKIIFAARNYEGLSSVPASGGTPQVVTLLDPKRVELTHRYPQVLPGAHAVLFVNNADPGGEGIIEVQPLPAGPRKNLIPAGAYGRYLPSGHLVYLHRGTLYAVPLDVRRLELTGQPAPVLEDVSFVTGTGAAGFTFSQSGIFAYAASDPEDQLRPLGMLDESGKLELLPVARARYVRARLSPDGKRLAVVIATSGTNIWIYESISRQFSRLPFASGNANNPVWAPDGKYLVFSSDAQTPGPGIFWMRADGAGEPRRLVEGRGLVPTSFSARAGLVYQAPEGPRGGLGLLPRQWNDGAQPKPGVPERFPQPFLESPAAFSPDGRWFAYVNGQVGQPEVFVRPFPGAGGPWQISSGGTSPVWSPTRRELFYRDITNFQIRVAGYSVVDDSFAPAKPRVWADLRVDRFDLMPDGKHALVVPAADQKETTHATFLLNFMDDLRRRLPAAK